MDWKECLAQIAGHLAWPVTVAVVLYWLRDRLGDLLPRLEKFRHKDTELEFSTAVGDVVEAVEELKGSSGPLSPDLQAEENRLLKIVDIASNTIVHQAYALVDRELLNLYDKALEGDGRKQLRVHEARRIRQAIGIPQDIEDGIEKARALRNVIMKNRRHLVSEVEARSYIELCLELTRELRQFSANESIEGTG